jgi:hypothetical protein
MYLIMSVSCTKKNNKSKRVAYRHQTFNVSYKRALLVSQDRRHPFLTPREKGNKGEDKRGCRGRDKGLKRGNPKIEWVKRRMVKYG